MFGTTGPLLAPGRLGDDLLNAVPKLFRPSIGPLEFLRVVAAEYLAAYQWEAEALEPYRADQDEARTGASCNERLDSEEPTFADVVDISTHPRFDDSVFCREFIARSPAGGESRAAASWPLRSA
jgi:hypothetical protein